MRSPAEAVSIILGRIAPLGETETVSLHSAAGRVLARDVASDLDLPPFPKSAMDGFAVRLADFADLPEGAEALLRVVGESRAGEPFTGTVGPGECVAIFTGAELPASCDAVVVVERSRREGERVHLADRPRPRQHVCERGEDLREGERVLSSGRRLRPTDLAVLAAVGCDPVPVWRRPRVAVLTTGDELVPPSQRPGPGQIREGNTLALAALSVAAGAEVVGVGVLRDDPAELERGLGRVLGADGAPAAADVLLTTGGVSMGRYDLVGEALAKIGVEPVFHKVAIKPGKPVWFGMHGPRPVFALPGNPVSCLVGHEVFVRPSLARLGGCEAETGERLRRGRWDDEATRPSDRQQNLPVAVTEGPDGLARLTRVRWNSSADVVGLSRSDGLAVVPPGAVLARGDLASYRPLA